MKRLALLPAILVAAFIAAPALCEEPKPVVAVSAPSNEETIRQRFLLAYQTAKTPTRKVETIEMLKGLKEKTSLRLLAGTLGDRTDLARVFACATMAATDDAEGYFVKPLIGALADKSPAVRIAAAQALAKAKVKGDAINALSFALLLSVGEKDRSAQNANTDVGVIKGYNAALQELTGVKCPSDDDRTISSFWLDHWKKNEAAIRAADKQFLGGEPVIAERPDNLEPDTFDRLKEKSHPQSDKKTEDSFGPIENARETK